MNINVTLVAQLISFAVFVWFTMKFVWPPLIRALEARRAQIADGLAAAERGRHEKDLAEKRAKDILHEAHAKATEIASQAQKRGSELVDEAKAQAKGEAERLRAATQAEIEQEISRAREHLREQVAQLAMAAAAKILEREVDANAHRDILDRAAAGL